MWKPPFLVRVCLPAIVALSLLAAPQAAGAAPRDDFALGQSARSGAVLQRRSRLG